MYIGRIRSKERDDDMAEQEKDILEEELGEEKSVEEQAPEEIGESQGESADAAEAEQDGGETSAEDNAGEAPRARIPRPGPKSGQLRSRQSRIRKRMPQRRRSRNLRIG